MFLSLSNELLFNEFNHLPYKQALEYFFAYSLNELRYKA